MLMETEVRGWGKFCYPSTRALEGEGDAFPLQLSGPQVAWFLLSTLSKALTYFPVQDPPPQEQTLPGACFI